MPGKTRWFWLIQDIQWNNAFLIHCSLSNCKPWYSPHRAHVQVLSGIVQVQQFTALFGCHQYPHLPLTSIWKLSSYRHSLCILISLAFRKECNLAWYPDRPGASRGWTTLNPGCAKSFSSLLGLKVEETCICFVWIHMQLALDVQIRYPGKLLRNTWLSFCMKSVQLKS